MSFIVENTSTGGDFTPVPAGLHLARCYRIVDLGTQTTEYMGETKQQRKIMLGWELHGKDDEGNELVTHRGDPLAIFKNYTLSWNEKANLRTDLQGWRNKPFTEEEMRRFDIATILGAWCMLNVIERPGQDGKTYTNVAGVTPVPSMIKQNGLPAAANKNELFKIDEPDMEMFNAFSENLKKKIASSPEWQKLHGQPQTPARQAPAKPAAAFEDDDIPF